MRWNMVHIHAVQNGPCAESTLRDQSAANLQLHTGAIMLPDPYFLHIVKVVLYIANIGSHKLIAPRHHRPSRARQRFALDYLGEEP